MPKRIRIPHFRIPRKLKKEWKKSEFSSLFYRNWYVNARNSWLRKVISRKLRRLCSFGSTYAFQLYKDFGY